MIRPPSPPSHPGEVPSRHRGRWVGQRCSGGAYTHSLTHQNIPGPAGRRIEELLMPGATCCFLMVIKVVFGKRERSGLPPPNSTLSYCAAEPDRTKVDGAQTVCLPRCRSEVQLRNASCMCAVLAYVCTILEKLNYTLKRNNHTISSSSTTTRSVKLGDRQGRRPAK